MAVDIARAWKDSEYRKSLTPEELATVPDNPAGNPELNDQDLDQVAGCMEKQNSLVVQCMVPEPKPNP
jgi:mersacidin/lichenicidin family type 2 lantibiotic